MLIACVSTKKAIMNYPRLFVILLLCTHQLKAQNNELSIMPSIGFASGLFDGQGYYIGVNPVKKLTDRFSAEGQISFISASGAAFLSGTQQNVQSLGMLLGGRFYLNSQENKTRFYLNTLIGLNYNNTENENRPRIEEYALALSGGVFVALNKTTIGLGFDTPQYFMLKVGYMF